jgi:hypothetical protein
MSLFGPVRALVSLGVDAGEALVELFNCNQAADELYARAQADRLAAREAEQEVTEPQTVDGVLLYECGDPSCGCQDDPRYGPLPTSSTAGVAPNPVVQDAPPPQTFPAAGQPKLPTDEERRQRRNEVWDRRYRESIATACAQIDELEAENQRLRTGISAAIEQRDLARSQRDDARAQASRHQ